MCFLFMQMSLFFYLLLLISLKLIKKKIKKKRNPLGAARRRSPAPRVARLRGLPASALHSQARGAAL